MSKGTGSSINVIRRHKCDFTRVQLRELMISLSFLTEHMGKSTHRVDGGFATVA